jgi:hypothetical protein
MTKPLAVFSLSICTSPDHRGRKKLRVYVWEHLKDLRRAAKESSTSSAHYWKNALGAYVGIRGPRQFGEIHLWRKFIGAGYFAHELQHFMENYRFLTEDAWLDDEANERMAYLAGDLTKRFYTRFYKMFDAENNLISEIRPE